MSSTTRKAGAGSARLKQIPVSKVDRNPDNPRIVFRQAELDELLDSIRLIGIQVPVSAYEHRGRYVLIDGERRWRCAIKLNLKTIPALVQERPSKLDNILLMFNIHALREQWDLLTIAMKLKEIIELMVGPDGKRPTEAELSKRTGHSRAVIRRCKLLLELPAEYHEMMLKELQKPKPQQKLTEDLFIEMERALKTVERAIPEAIPDKDKVRRVLIAKFRQDIIPNRVHFRKVAKIARAANVDADVSKAKMALVQLFARNDVSIESAYERSVSEAYDERDVLTRIDGLIERLRDYDSAHLDDHIRVQLRALIAEAQRLVGDGP